MVTLIIVCLAVSFFVAILFGRFTKAGNVLSEIDKLDEEIDALARKHGTGR